eukprot:tig00000718_g3737.t1
MTLPPARSPLLTSGDCTAHLDEMGPSDDVPHPRINGGMVRSMAGKPGKAILVGRVLGTSGATVTIEASDGAEVIVAPRAQSAGLYNPGSVLEVTGTVNATGVVQETEQPVDLGANFDLKRYNQLVGFANNQYAGLFKV